jgi:hypothetical protein
MTARFCTIFDADGALLSALIPRLAARFVATYVRKMPLHLCPVEDTDDDTRDAYVFMTGGYCVGAFNRVARRHRDGDWIWGAGFGHPLDDGGRVGTAREAKDAIVVSFRQQLARIGLAEVEGAGERERESASEPSRLRKPALPAYWDVARQARRPAHMYSRASERPRIARITSGDLPIGVLREVTSGARAGDGTGHWSWAITGTRHNPPDFIWNGCTSSLEESQDALLWAWSTWIAWAGLRQVRAPQMSRPIRSLC